MKKIYTALIVATFMATAGVAVAAQVTPTITSWCVSDWF